jgi:acyl-CoA synthetase (AMP-forming)/AMP-acid ligase II
VQGDPRRRPDPQSADVDPAEVRAFVKARIGGVKAPKEVLVWDDLPRSKVGKVVKPEIRAQLLGA